VNNTKVAENSNIGYRYVSEGEYQFIKANGYIPNTDMAGNVKDVYVSPNKYNTVSDSENGLKIGAQNPNGPTNSPEYRVEFKLNSVKYDYMGDVQGGTGVELTTRQSIPVNIKKITKLKSSGNKNDKNNSSGSGSSGGNGGTNSNSSKSNNGVTPIMIMPDMPSIPTLPEIPPIFRIPILGF
jgi:hypothetical protein